MNHNNVETERKFLVLNDSFLQEAVRSYRIRQGYIAHDGGNTVRVRIRDDQGFLTIKGPSLDGISRFEWERELPLPDAEALAALCHGFIDKTRHLVPAGAERFFEVWTSSSAVKQVCPYTLRNTLSTVWQKVRARYSTSWYSSPGLWFWLHFLYSSKKSSDIFISSRLGLKSAMWSMPNNSLFFSEC